MTRIGKTSDIIEAVETIRVHGNNIEFEVDTQGEGEQLILCLHVMNDLCAILNLSTVLLSSSL